jgi:hypothetical protein
VGLAQELSNRGDGVAAMREMDKTLKLDPNRDILWLLAAVVHERGGDLEGSKLALEEYVKRVPQNLPAQSILERMKTAGSKSQAQPGRPGGTMHPFEWSVPTGRTVYANDERAPELTEIHFPTSKFTSLPHPRPIPDYLVTLPEIHSLQVERQALVESYQNAPPEKTLEIRKQLQKNADKTDKKLQTFVLDD